MTNWFWFSDGDGWKVNADAASRVLPHTGAATARALSGAAAHGQAVNYSHHQMKDPICGMTVNPDNALQTERDGQTHYFCSDECRQQFLAAPAVTHRHGAARLARRRSRAQRKGQAARSHSDSHTRRCDARHGTRPVWTGPGQRQTHCRVSPRTGRLPGVNGRNLCRCQAAKLPSCGWTTGANLLIMHIQPDEGITLQMRAKMPGPTISTRAVTLDFDYSQFGNIAPTTGYEKLLYDCIMGDATHFHRADMVEAAWKVADPILNTWASHPREHMPTYAPGTWGPPEAKQHHRWQSC